METCRPCPWRELFEDHEHSLVIRYHAEVAVQGQDDAPEYSAAAARMIRETMKSDMSCAANDPEGINDVRVCPKSTLLQGLDIRLEQETWGLSLAQITTAWMAKQGNQAPITFRSWRYLNAGEKGTS